MVWHVYPTPDRQAYIGMNHKQSSTIHWQWSSYKKNKQQRRAPVPTLEVNDYRL